MTSSINPNNIDTAYPVAGQDNNTQGFRTNFTNIKNNFLYAEDEINALQNNAIFKGPLTIGGSVDNNMGGSLFYNAQVQQLSFTRAAHGVVSGTVPINYASGHYHTLTTGGSVVLTFSNFPAAAEGAVRVQITISSTAHTVTIPSTVTVNNAGVQGLNTSTNVITFAAPGIYEFEFSSYTGSIGGSTITINQTNTKLLPLNNSSEDLANAAAASLAVNASYFSTGGAETATLAAGVEGQVKVFAMVATAGNMVITVSNAGWKSSGTGSVTFSSIGQACTLQYINSKWFCIGNNGATFA